MTSQKDEFVKFWDSMRYRKAFCTAYFGGSLILEGLIIGRNFAFQNELRLTIKQLKTLRKQPKTPDTNSPSAYKRGAYFWVSQFFFWGGRGLLSEFHGIWKENIV